MGRLRKPLVTALAVMCLVAAGVAESASIKVDETHSQTADFSAYKTFDIEVSKTIAEPDLRETLEAMIASELTRKGLTGVEDGGDLVVTYDGAIGSRDQVFTHLGYAVQTLDGSTTVYTVGLTVPVGAIVITMIDRARGEVVWQAMGQGMVKPGAQIEKRIKRLAKAVKKVLASYPPRG